MDINTQMAGPSHFLKSAAGVRCRGGGGGGGEGGGTVWPPLGAGIVLDMRSSPAPAASRSVSCTAAPHTPRHELWILGFENRRCGLRSPGMAPKADAEQVHQIRRDVLTKLRSESPTVEADLVTQDANIQRFYRATGGNLTNTVKRLVATAKWRLETKPTCMDCPSCLKDPMSHYMHL